MLAQRVTVTVHGTDPLSRSGAISHLRHEPTIRLIESPDAPVPETAETVAVALVDQVDEASATELRRIARGGDQRVVLVVRELREPELLKVVEYGVRAILWRHQATGQRLLKAVHSAARGEGELPPDLISRLLVQVGQLRRSATAGEAGGPGRALPLFGMAAREVDVVRLIAEGLDTRQISEKLAYSERTVKNILHALMTRLQLTNRAHAVAYALREGYI
ncbi:response regulator transcription factor [Streptomyces sp. NPDC050738]|uniref:helix-turn-helix transcriptional regulator n=1 Tax=Streptomyces sp. NPDC050738 TaxID=3154744 RepID=UPI003416B682